MKVLFKVDITNENKTISKDHDNMIHSGTELEVAELTEGVQRLVDLGMVEVVKEVEKVEEKAPEQEEKKEAPKKKKK